MKALYKITKYQKRPGANSDKILATIKIKKPKWQEEIPQIINYKGYVMIPIYTIQDYYSEGFDIRRIVSCGKATDLIDNQKTS